MTLSIRFMFILTLIITNFAIAQNKGQLTYKKIINDNFVPSARTENYIVYFNGSRSMEVNLPLTPIIPPISDSQSVSVGAVQSRGGKSYFLIKDFKTETIIQGTDVQSKYYLVEDTLSNFVWIITKEKKQILDYNCTKATTTFRGRNYEAWFTEEVPVKNGPWKFCGLPGLIVKVGDTDNVYTFNLVAVNFDSTDKSLEIPEKYLQDKVLSHREFVSRYNREVKELASKSDVYSDLESGETITVKGSFPPIIEKF